jgi:hypothetical protein
MKNRLESQFHRLRLAAVLLALSAGAGRAGISIGDYSVGGSSCAGASTAAVTFTTPVAVQYRVQSYAPQFFAGPCHGVNGGNEQSAARGYLHLATDWNHPFVVATDVRVEESWRSDAGGCIGALEGASCTPRSWYSFGAGYTTRDRVAHYDTLYTTGQVQFLGVNEYNNAWVSGWISSHPNGGYLLEGAAGAVAEGETPIAFSYSANTPPPTSLGVHVLAKAKLTTTVNVPMPHASFVFIEGQMVQDVYAALSGSPVPRTFKNPSSPTTRQQVMANTSSAVGVISGEPVNELGGSGDGPTLVTPECDSDITACERWPIYYGTHAGLLNQYGLYRSPLPANVTGTGTTIIGEVVTFEVVPARPAYDANLGPYGWAFQVASKLGKVVKRQPIYAESYYGSAQCTPPTLSLSTTLTAKRGVWTRVQAVTASTPANEEIVVQFRADDGLLQTNATVAGVTATGSGSGTVALRGLRTAVQAALTQRIVWYRNSTPDAESDSIAVSAWRTASPTCKVTRVIGVNITEQNLLNIDFGVTGNVYGWSDKYGYAATGFSSGDIWEAISYYYNSALVWSDGSNSGASVSLNNSATQSATPSVGFSHPDAMFNDYNVRSGTNVLGATITQLPAGTYDVYVYAHRGTANGNSKVTLKRSGVTLGSSTTTSDAIGSTEAWSEGRQYVLFRNIAVAAGQSLEVLSSGPNGTGSGCLNGMQLLRK